MSQKSIQHKVGFLSSFLERLGYNYDYSLPKGDISGNKMFQEISNDIKGIGARRDAGVCRHMHMLAVKAATAMGLKMTYGLSYTTATGYHLNMILTNPENPRETIRFNYEKVSFHERQGLYRWRKKMLLLFQEQLITSGEKIITPFILPLI